MVGDWVYMKAHRGFDSQYIKVETIPDSSSDTHYGHIGAYPISEDMDFRDIEDSHLEPIPLTPEILEKNGFSRNGLDIALFDRKGGDDFVGAANLQFVHELQHALRLCGIKKEIVL